MPDDCYRNTLEEYEEEWKQAKESNDLSAMMAVIEKGLDRKSDEGTGCYLIVRHLSSIKNNITLQTQGLQLATFYTTYQMKVLEAQLIRTTFWRFDMYGQPEGEDGLDWKLKQHKFKDLTMPTLA